MKAPDLKITDLIPQRPPVVMIDRLEEADERCATGILTVKASNIFADQGVFTEAGLTEFIAQTAAGFKGYQKITSGNDVREGYIAAVKNLKINFLPPAGSTLKCRIRVENELMGFTIITGRVCLGEDEVAEAEMRIILDNQEP